MNDLAKRMESLENRILPQPDKAWQRDAKLGVFWMSVGIIVRLILELLLYDLNRLDVPLLWRHRQELIHQYDWYYFGIPGLAFAFMVLISMDYLRRQTANKRHRTRTSKMVHLVFYGLMGVGGFVGFALLAEFIESAVWKTFMEQQA